MTTDRPTAADIRGETQRGRDAYNERRRMLRARGILGVPDLYGDAVNDEDAPYRSPYEADIIRLAGEMAREDLVNGEIDEARAAEAALKRLHPGSGTRNN